MGSKADEGDDGMTDPEPDEVEESEGARGNEAAKWVMEVGSVVPL